MLDKQRFAKTINNIGEEAESLSYAMERFGEAVKQLGDELAHHARMDDWRMRLDGWWARFCKFIRRNK